MSERQERACLQDLLFLTSQLPNFSPTLGTLAYFSSLQALLLLPPNFRHFRHLKYFRHFFMATTASHPEWRGKVQFFIDKMY
jgi:hypothetical protein